MAKFTNDNVISLDSLVEKANKYEEIETYTLDNGEDMQFFPHFSRTKLAELVEEFQGYMQSENKTDQKYAEVITKDEFNLVLFWQFLAVKKFTHFGEQMKRVKTLRGLMPYYNALLETGILDEIINDVFLYEELKKVNDIFATTSSTMNAALEFIEKYENQLQDKRDQFKERLSNNTQSE